MFFDEFARGHELYGSVQNNGRFPDWNTANTSTPTFYGQPYGNTIPGYVAPQLDVAINTVLYKYNNVDDTMEIETVNSKGKVKIKKLSNGFAITDRTESCDDIGETVFATITYSTKTFSGITIIPGNDYTDGKYDKHFEHIVRLPGCSKAELNALIGFAINTASCQKQILFPHQGICEFENGVINFAGNPGFIKEIEKYISPSVLKRKCAVSFVPEEQIKAEWRKFFCQQPALCFLSNWYIMGLMQYFLKQAGINIRDFLCIKPSNMASDLTEEKLTTMFSTNNFHKYPVITLESGEETIKNEYSEVYDGVFLVKDRSFADEEHKIIDGVKAVIRCIRANNACRNVSVMVSKNAGYIAVNLASENAVIINTKGVAIDYTAEEIERITDEMTYLIYSKALNNPDATKKWFKETVSILRHKLSSAANGDSLDTLSAMLTIELFLAELGINRYNFDLYNYYLTTLKSKGEKIMSSNMEKKKELGAKLSEKFRSKTFRFVKKEHNVRLNDDGKTGVISGNRLLVSLAMLGSVTDDVESTIMTFRTDGDLICTDGHTHPFDSHDITGKYQRLYFYDLPADILDEDVLYMLQNPETAAFLLTKEESNIKGFTPLISDKSGKTAGKRFAYNDAENDSVIVYGQSGEGKTHTVCQIMAHRYSLGHDIVIFDSSDSFTYEAMCHNLPRKFVDKNIVFYNLYHGKLHINPFIIERNASLTSQKKELFGLLTAGVGNLSEAQKSTLRSALSKLLSTPDKGTFIKADELIAMLDEEGGSYEALRNRLNPFLEDIRECNLVNGSWNDYFNSSRKIHIIQMNAVFSENGNQIIDVLLASLFNYKRENPQRPLSVIIDEVQNQNFSASSPIRKILKEGRKHHLSIVAATQDFYPRGTEIGSALGKAGMQIFHRPTQDSANLVAAELRFKKADMERFDSMERGDVIIKGALYNKEQGRNMQTIMSGHIVDYLMTDEDDKSR